MTKADAVKIVQAFGMLLSGFVLIFANSYFLAEAFINRYNDKLTR